MSISPSVDHLETWEQKGYVQFPSFLSETETNDLKEWVEQISSWPPDPEKWMHHFEQIGPIARPARTEYIIDFHDGLRRLLTTGKVPETAGSLLGQPVVLYKEKINYKYPGGGGYAAHQDAPAYEFVKLHITCSIAIDDATPENGCLYFAPELHREGLIHLNDQGCIEESKAKSLNWEPIPMKAGDALFFSSYAPHYSPSNQTDQSRRTLYLTYNALAEGDLRESYYADKRQAFADAAKTGDQRMRVSKIGHFNGKPPEQS